MDFFRNLENLKKKIILNKSTKESFRSRLIDTILTRSDIREAEIFRQNTQRSNILHFLQYKFMPIFLIVAMLVSAGGGVSLAAENTLPGDALYPIKVGFNEKVVAAFSASADAKANWEVRLAERRLEEAADLTAQGRMSAEVEENIKSRFAAHAEKVGERIAEIEARGNIRNASEVASRFETSLKIHGRILGKLELATSSDASAKVGRIKVKVDSEFEKTKGSRERLESEVEDEDGGSETKSAAKGKISAAKNVISSVREQLGRNKEGLSAEVISGVEAQIKIAESMLLSAEAKFDAGVYGEAFVLAQSALRAAQEARGAIDVSAEVREAISREEKEGSDRLEKFENSSSSRKDDDIELETKTETKTEVGGDSREIDSSGRVKIRFGL